jgi:bis(5'-nucleosyl)-tetraphosphatase (symmetrical)
MATYAIGDIQGCYLEFRELLALIGFNAGRDRLWLVGDLVNRGPGSLEVLRFVKGLGDTAVTVLGNHDFHLLRIAAGYGRERRGDTLGAILDAPDREEVLDWLARRPLVHREGKWLMVHAGLIPAWSADRAEALAREVEAVLAAALLRRNGQDGVQGKARRRVRARWIPAVVRAPRPRECRSHGHLRSLVDA